MLDAPTSGFRQDCEWARTRAVDIPTAPRQTPTKSALQNERSPEAGGPNGWQNLPESELVGLLHLIGLYGERTGPAASLGQTHSSGGARN
jgi:hypothetical protein